MNKIFFVILLIIFTGCHNKQERKSDDSSLTKFNDTIKSGKIRSSTYNKKAVDSLIRAGLISPDSIPDLPPSQSEEREKLTKKYDQIERVDSTFINNNDTLQDQSRIVLDFPISIPATDLGLGQFLIISKNGDYKFAENY